MKVDPSIYLLCYPIASGRGILYSNYIVLLGEFREETNQ